MQGELGRLRLANAFEQVERDRLTASAWGGRRPVAEFLQREQALRGHHWARSTMRSWWWVGDDELCRSSCETFVMPSQVGERRGTSLLIASVFTEPRWRHAGHASAMLRALVERAPTENHQALVLFSEIGVELYARLGFTAVPSFDVVLPARENPKGLLPECNRVERSFVSTMGALALDRTAAQLDWQLERERFFAAAWQRPRPTTSTACLQGSSIGWAAYYKTNELHVLWLDAQSDAVRVELLQAAQHAAWQAGLAQVRVWVTGNASWAQTYEAAKVLRRDDEVPMFLPLQAGISSWVSIERGMWA